MVLIWCVLCCVFKSLHHASGWWSRCLRVESGEGSALSLCFLSLCSICLPMWAQNGVEKGKCYILPSGCPTPAKPPPPGLQSSFVSWSCRAGPRTHGSISWFSEGLIGESLFSPTAWELEICINSLLLLNLHHSSQPSPASHFDSKSVRGSKPLFPCASSLPTMLLVFTI